MANAGLVHPSRAEGDGAQSNARGIVSLSRAEGDGERPGLVDPSRAQGDGVHWNARGIRSPMPSRRRRHGDRNARSNRQLTLAFGERKLAERAGFEPAVRFPVHTLSKRAP